MHFGESLSGLSSIRAYKKTDSFIEKSDRLVDENQMAYAPNIASYRYASDKIIIRLNFFKKKVFYSYSVYFCHRKYSIYVAGVNHYCISCIINFRWLGIILDFIGNLIALCACLFALLQRDTIGASLAGLSITYALQVSANICYILLMLLG